MKVVCCLIATRKYKTFIQPLIDSIKKFFLVNYQIEIHLFIDDISFPCEGDGRVKIIKDLIVSYQFPEATLFRYAIMTSKQYECDYMYYLDVDYLITDFVDEEIFGDIVAVLHPGFSVVGGGSWCNDENSNAYTFPENRVQYFAGGTQGGSYNHYYRAMKKLKREIDDDEKRNVRCEWNDEGHWNKMLSELNNFKILDSSYCMVQQPELQVAWKINHLPKRIIALEKKHDQIRS